MNGNRILVDTNILIYFTLGFKQAEKYFFDFHPIVSFITELEVLSWTDFGEESLRETKSFLVDQIIIDYLPGMKNIIVGIRSKKLLKLPDAIIASTAIYLDIPLVSSDKSFKNVKGLDFYYHEPPKL
jgi:predicted nucleic acid-binding protein